MPLGYDFYGKRTKPDRKGVTVVANTAMVAELFWIRGVEIDTRVENDEPEVNPDNVVIGEMTGLTESDHSCRFSSVEMLVGINTKLNTRLAIQQRADLFLPGVLKTGCLKS